MTPIKCYANVLKMTMMNPVETRSSKGPFFAKNIRTVRNPKSVQSYRLFPNPTLNEMSDFPTIASRMR